MILKDGHTVIADCVRGRERERGGGGGGGIVGQTLFSLVGRLTGCIEQLNGRLQA